MPYFSNLPSNPLYRRLQYDFRFVFHLRPILSPLHQFHYNLAMQENAENSMKTVVGRPFLPGQTGNAGGRPKGLASYIRDTTDGGREMVDLMVAVMRGETVDGKKPKVRDRMDAVSWLADRGFGRAIAQIEARSLNVDMSLSELSSENLLAALNIAKSSRE